TGGLLLRRLVAVAGGFDDQIRHALGVFLLGDVAARESADGPAARLGRAPAAVGLRAFLDRLVLGHEGDIGHRQGLCGRVLERNRLAEALDRVLDAVRRLVARLDPRYLHEAVLEAVRRQRLV